LIFTTLTCFSPLLSQFMAKLWQNFSTIFCDPCRNLVIDLGCNNSLLPVAIFKDKDRLWQEKITKRDSIKNPFPFRHSENLDLKRRENQCRYLNILLKDSWSEAKSGNTFTAAWCKGIRAIEPLEGFQRRIVVCPRGPAMRTRDRIDVLLFKHFANELAAGVLWLSTLKYRWPIGIQNNLCEQWCVLESREIGDV